MRCGYLWVLFAARKGWGGVGFCVGCECVAYRQFHDLQLGSPRVSGIPFSGLLFGGMDIYGNGDSEHGFGLVVARNLCFRLQPLCRGVRTERVGFLECGACVSLGCGVPYGLVLE